jgi:hypothetical protein
MIVYACFLYFFFRFLKNSAQDIPTLIYERIVNFMRIGNLDAAIHITA